VGNWLPWTSAFLKLLADKIFSAYFGVIPENLPVLDPSDDDVMQGINWIQAGFARYAMEPADSTCSFTPKAQDLQHRVVARRCAGRQRLVKTFAQPGIAGKLCHAACARHVAHGHQKKIWIRIFQRRGQVLRDSFLVVEDPPSLKFCICAPRRSRVAQEPMLLLLHRPIVKFTQDCVKKAFLSAAPALISLEIIGYSHFVWFLHSLLNL
jgi:hypothetical protein